MWTRNRGQIKELFLNWTFLNQKQFGKKHKKGQKNVQTKKPYFVNNVVGLIAINILFDN